MPGPSDLRDNSPGAIAGRRAYWNRRAGETRRRASTRDASRRSSGTRRASSSASVPNARSAREFVRSRKVENKAGLAALLFFGLIAVAAARRGAAKGQLFDWPDAAGFGSIALGTLIVVAASLVAPDVVVMVLFVALLILAITNANVVVGLADRIGADLRRTVAA